MDIAIITRTHRRPIYFNRCSENVASQNISGAHYVISDTQEDTYQSNHVVKYVDRDSYADYDAPPPIEIEPKVKAIHNLYFNEVYSDLSEEWVYHLDDDNCLLPNAFGEIDHLLSNPEVDVIIFRIRYKVKSGTIPVGGLLPNDDDFKNKRIRLYGIDTACFMVRSELARRVKWDGWKCGDYRFIKACDDLSRNTVWVDHIVMEVDNKVAVNEYGDLDIK